MLTHRGLPEVLVPGLGLALAGLAALRVRLPDRYLLEATTTMILMTIIASVLITIQTNQ